MGPGQVLDRLDFDDAAQLVQVLEAQNLETSQEIDGILHHREARLHHPRAIAAFDAQPAQGLELLDSFAQRDA